MPLIQLHEVTKSYPNDVTALDNIRLDIESGEWIAVMGPSGAGKSTLLHLIAALDKPTSGAILVNGCPVHNLGPSQAARYRRESIGMIFQQFHLIPYLTAQENVMIAQYFHSLPDAQEAAETLTLLGLGDRLEHYPHQLSGGEQQRVAIARAIINNPTIILADEPTGNLDEASEQAVLEILSEINHQGKTIILVTHSPRVARLAHRQIFMEHGRLIEHHLESSLHHPAEDEILETLWKFLEHGETNESQLLLRAEMITRDDIRTAVERGWIRHNTATSTLTFSPAGEERAKHLVRRHRLAEYLLEEIFQLEPRRAQETACQFEHILSPEVTDAMCAFLNHPRQCPHGHPIPRGPCCSVGP